MSLDDEVQGGTDYDVPEFSWRKSVHVAGLVTSALCSYFGWHNLGVEIGAHSDLMMYSQDIASIVIGGAGISFFMFYDRKTTGHSQAE